jgi:hypothetical protein
MGKNSIAPRGLFARQKELRHVGPTPSGGDSFMQENTESEKLEDSDSLDNEENFPDVEAAALPENSESDLPESDPQFEEQGEEALPPEEKKKSGAGKFFLFLILILAGSGGYLYFNNLIPSEILNLVFPKQVPPKPSALVAEIPPTPLPIEEDVFKMPVIIPVPRTVPPTLPETQETHISGSPVDSLPPTRISGNNFDQIPETKPVEEPKKSSQDTASVAEPETIVSPIVEPPETVEPSEPLAERNESVQAYLDFIESSVQKLGELIKEGFTLGWDYMTEKLG